MKLKYNVFYRGIDLKYCVEIEDLTKINDLCFKLENCYEDANKITFENVSDIYKFRDVYDFDIILPNNRIFNQFDSLFSLYNTFMKLYDQRSEIGIDESLFDIIKSYQMTLAKIIDNFEDKIFIYKNYRILIFNFYFANLAISDELKIDNSEILKYLDILPAITVGVDIKNVISDDLYVKYSRLISKGEEYFNSNDIYKKDFEDFTELNLKLAKYLETNSYTNFIKSQEESDAIDSVLIINSIKISNALIIRFIESYNVKISKNYVLDDEFIKPLKSYVQYLPKHKKEYFKKLISEVK